MKKNSYKVCDPTLFELPGLHMDINMFTGTRADVFLDSFQNAFLGARITMVKRQAYLKTNTKSAP